MAIAFTIITDERYYLALSYGLYFVSFSVICLNYTTNKRIPFSILRLPCCLPVILACGISTCCISNESHLSQRWQTYWWYSWVKFWRLLLTYFVEIMFEQKHLSKVKNFANAAKQPAGEATNTKRSKADGKWLISISSLSTYCAPLCHACYRLRQVERRLPFLICISGIRLIKMHIVQLESIRFALEKVSANVDKSDQSTSERIELNELNRC